MLHEDKLYPILRSIRAKCVDCGLGSRDNIRECEVKACGLYPYRMTATKPDEMAAADIVDVCTALINKCVNCSCTTIKNFKDCDITSCQLNKRISVALEVVYARRDKVVNY